jgi:tetratricopeptide (TPR) repeat protein
MIRADYGTFSPALNLNPAMATISDKADQLSKFFSYFIEDFGWSVGILSAVGLLAGIRKKLRITIFLAIFFFLSGIFFISYANFPIDDPSGFGLVCVERFYLLPYLIAGLLSGLGINILSVFVKNSRLLSVIFNIFLVFCLVMILISNFSVVNQSQNYFGLKFGQNILKNLPKDALIVNQGDLPIFVTFYARYVEGFRSDVEIMTANASGIQNNFRYLKKTRPQFNWQSSGTATVSEVIEANFQKVPIYWFGPVGIDVPGTLASPSGLLFNFFPPEKAQDFAQWEHENRQILVSYDLPSPSQIQQNDTIADYSLVWYYARMFSTLGNFCGKNFHYDCARDFFQSAIKFDPYALPKHFGLAKAYELGKNCAKAEEEYRHILKLNSEANVIYFELANLARTCFKDEAKAKYFEEQMAGKQIGLNDSLEGL